MAGFLEDSGERSRLPGRQRQVRLSALMWALCAFLALGASSVGAQVLPAADARQFRRAVESVQAKDYGAAERMLAELARKHPRHPDVHEALAVVLDLQGKTEAATPHFEIAAKGKPESADLRMNLAVNYAQRGLLEKAEREFRALLRLRPRDASAHFNLGTLLLRRQQFEGALPYLEQARRLQPSDFANGYQLALCYFLLRRHEQAQQTLDAIAAHGDPGLEYITLRGLNLKALGRDGEAQPLLARARSMLPPLPEALAALGPLFFHTGQQAEALSWFELTWQRNPESLTAATYLARAQIGAGHLERARATLTVALEKWPSAELHHLMGRTEEGLGNYVSAAQHLQRAVELDPSEANLYALAYEFLAHWNWDAALTVLKTALDLYPKSVRVRLGMATAQYAKAEYNSALDALLEAVRLEPRNETAHRMMAAIFPHSSGRADAVLSRQRALAVAEPQNPWANYVYALALWQNPDRPVDEEEMAEARRLLARAAQLGPGHAEVQYHFGLLLFERSEWRESIRALEAASRLNPDYVEAHYRLALAYQRVARGAEAQATMARYVRLKEQQDARLDERTAKTATFLFDLKP